MSNKIYYILVEEYHDVYTDLLWSLSWAKSTDEIWAESDEAERWCMGYVGYRELTREEYLAMGGKEPVKSKPFTNQMDLSGWRASA